MVAVTSLEEVAVEMTVGLAMADHRLDGGASPELAFDLTMSTSLLSGSEDPERLWRVMPDISFVDIDPLDLAASQSLGFLYHLSQCVAIIRFARQGLGVKDELTALGPSVGGGERDLDAELVRLLGFALRQTNMPANGGDSESAARLAHIYVKGLTKDADLIDLAPDNDMVRKYAAISVRNAEGNEPWVVSVNKLHIAFVIDDYLFLNDIRTIDATVQDIQSTCGAILGNQERLNCGLDKIWAYVDVSNNGGISLAELSRLQRHIVKYMLHKQNPGGIGTEDKLAANTIGILLMPILASSVLHSYDYDNNGELSRSELVDSPEMGELISGGPANILDGLNFGKLMQRASGAVQMLKILK